MTYTAQANADIDYMDGYRYGKKHGLVSEDQVRQAILRLPSRSYRMGVGHRFAEGYFQALQEMGIWTPGRGEPAPWADWKLPVH